MFNRRESPDATPDSIGASTGSSSSLEDSSAVATPLDSPGEQPAVHGERTESAPSRESTAQGSKAQVSKAQGSKAQVSTAQVSTLEKDHGEQSPEAPRTARRQHPILLADEASRWLGLEVVDFGPGHATCTMVLRPEMLNGHGTGHGGMIFSLADSTFAIACNDPAAADTMTVAAGVDITYLAPALPGRVLTATAVHRASMGRSGLYDVTVTQDEGHGEPTIIAEFRGRSRTVPRRT